ELEDLRGAHAPGGHAVDESLTDELADLHVVEADVVGVAAGEGRPVVADRRDAVRRGIRLDLRPDGAVQRVEYQDGGAQRDVRLRVGELRRVAALGVVDLEVRRGVPGRGERLHEVGSV